MIRCRIRLRWSFTDKGESAAADRPGSVYDFCRYSPVLLNGRPEKFVLTVAITFRLEEQKR